MNTDYDITLVEKYFDRELTEAESSEFHERLLVDQSFKSLVEQEKALIRGIHLEGLHRDLRFLKSVEQNLDNKKIFSINRLGKAWYYAAAAVVILAVATVGLLLYSRSETSDELFARYYDKPYTNIFEPTTRGTADYTTQRAEAFLAYDNGDYARAAELFNQLLKDKEEPGVLMLLGNSNLMLGRVDEAKQNFLTLLNDFDDLDLPAKWFLSLCYLKSGDVENARRMLKELGETEVSYATKAKELLNKVN